MGHGAMASAKPAARKTELEAAQSLTSSLQRTRQLLARQLDHTESTMAVMDESGKTLASASSRDKAIRESLTGLKKSEVASKIGAEIATKAKAAGVSKISFDRGSYKYHGRVRALADAAREGGLEF